MYSFEIYKREKKIQIGSKDFLLSHVIVRINMENTKVCLTLYYRTLLECETVSQNVSATYVSPSHNLTTIMWEVALSYQY